MYWDDELAFRITAKKGPVRVMNTLLDANRALTQDLPAGYLKKAHWREAGWALFKAGDNGKLEDIRAATETLVRALEIEGWMSPDLERIRTERLTGCLRVIEVELRQCVAARRYAGKPALKLVVSSSEKPLPSQPIELPVSSQPAEHPIRREQQRHVR